MVWFVFPQQFSILLFIVCALFEKLYRHISVIGCPFYYHITVQKSLYAHKKPDVCSAKWRNNNNKKLLITIPITKSFHLPCARSKCVTSSYKHTHIPAKSHCIRWFGKLLVFACWFMNIFSFFLYIFSL